MGKGGYLGGSTVVRIHPKANGKGRTRGILALESEYAKTGTVRRESLLPQPPNKASKSKAEPNPEPKSAKPVRPPARTAAPASRAAAQAVVSKAPEGAYSYAAIQAYVRQHHPNCKGRALKRVAKLGALGRWSGMELREVVASCMEQHLLYEVFSLPGLVACGYSQEQALKTITPLVADVLSHWGSKPVWLARGEG